jgi:hypothetical protein
MPATIHPLKFHAISGPYPAAFSPFAEHRSTVIP